MKLVFGDTDSIKLRDLLAPKSGGGVPSANRTTSPWRLEARRVIAETVAKYPGHDAATLKSELSRVYPFGQREYTPYRIWLQEVKAALARVAGGN